MASIDRNHAAEVKLQAAESDAADRKFCWHVVQRVRPLFRITYPYVAREQAVGVLALHALFASIEEVFYRVSDEAVARAKLTWWSEQLMGPEYERNTHPVVRQLHRSQAIAPAARSALARMLQTSLDRLGAPPPVNEDELKLRCFEIGLYPTQLEMALSNGAGMEQAPVTFCAVNGLVQLLRESCRKPGQSYEWIPLNLLARHGLSRNEMKDSEQSTANSRLMESICQLGASWRAPEQAEADGGGGACGVSAVWPKPALHRHCLIQSEMNLRLLRRLQRVRLQQHVKVLGSANLGDAWYAWRCALKATAKGKLG